MKRCVRAIDHIVRPFRLARSTEHSRDSQNVDGASAVKEKGMALGVTHGTRALHMATLPESVNQVRKETTQGRG
jgi:hypothetical protein